MHECMVYLHTSLLKSQNGIPTRLRDVSTPVTLPHGCSHAPSVHNIANITFILPTETLYFLQMIPTPGCVDCV